MPAPTPAPPPFQFFKVLRLLKKIKWLRLPSTDLHSCPKNDVILFSRKSFCALGLIRIEVGESEIVRFEVRVKS